MLDFLFRRNGVISFNTGLNFSVLCVIANDFNSLRPLRIDLTRDTINKTNNSNIPVSKYIKIFYHKDFGNSNPHFYHSIKEKDKNHRSSLLKFDKSYIILDVVLKKQNIKRIIKTLGFSESVDFNPIDNAEVANDFDNYFFTYIMCGNQMYAVVRYNMSIGQNYTKVDLMENYKEFIVTKENSKSFYINELNCILTFCKIENVDKALEFMARRTIIKEIENTIKC